MPALKSKRHSASPPTLLSHFRLPRPKQAVSASKRAKKKKGRKMADSIADYRLSAPEIRNPRNFSLRSADPWTNSNSAGEILSFGTRSFRIRREISVSASEPRLWIGRGLNRSSHAIKSDFLEFGKDFCYLSGRNRFPTAWAALLTRYCFSFVVFCSEDLESLLYCEKIETFPTLVVYFGRGIRGRAFRQLGLSFHLCVVFLV